MPYLFKRVLPAAALVILVITGAVYAQGNTGGSEITRSAGSLNVPRGTIVDGNVSLGAGELTVNGIVNGDVYGNLGQVNIYGIVNGNVELNSGQLVVTGNVTGNVTLHLGEVVVDGNVGGDLDSGLGSAVIAGSVAGDVNSVAGTMQIAGTVGGNVTATDKSRIVIEGEVGGDVTLSRGLVELGPRAVVNGRVFVEQGLVKPAEGAVASSYEVVNQLTEAEVDRMLRSGEVTVDDNEAIITHLVFTFRQLVSGIRFIPEIRIPDGWRLFPFFRYGPWHPFRILFNMAVLFALAALTRVLFPKQVRSAEHTVERKTAAAFGWGLLAVILAVPLAIFLVITIIGIPLILVEFLLLALAGILGYTALVGLIGKKTITAGSSRKVNPILAIAVGVVLLSLVTMIPVLGALLGFGIFILVVGAAVASRFGTAKITGDPGEEGGTAGGE